MADRDKLLDRIRKLRAKGGDAGVTEAEANAFLDAAARMMAEHAIADDDLDRAGMSVGIIEKKGVHVSMHKMHPACSVLAAIGRLTGTSIGVRVETRVFVDGHRRDIGGLTISGRAPDREVADYTFDQVRNLIDGAWKTERSRRLAFLKRSLREDGVSLIRIESLLRNADIKAAMTKHGHGVGSKERRSYGFGMACRIADRIEKMAVRRVDSENALAVWKEHCSVTGGRNKSRPDIDSHAYLAGQVAGAGVDLGQGVATGQRAVLRLGAQDRTET